MFRAPAQNGGRRSPARRAGTNGLLQLGWPHFWLLSSILAGIMGLIAFVFLAHAFPG